MLVTQEVVNATISYRLEHADQAALVREAREARQQRPSRLRRWLTRSESPPVRRATPALP
jgi:hypothetical protein